MSATVDTFTGAPDEVLADSSCHSTAKGRPPLPCDRLASSVAFWQGGATDGNDTSTRGAAGASGAASDTVAFPTPKNGGEADFSTLAFNEMRSPGRMTAPAPSCTRKPVPLIQPHTGSLPSCTVTFTNTAQPEGAD